MKILINGLNFAPELTGIGKYTGEMAAWLSAAGHEVRVVTAPPYYPEWQVGAGGTALFAIFPCAPAAAKNEQQLLSNSLDPLYQIGYDSRYEGNPHHGGI